jgi:hypothetical protein
MAERDQTLVPTLSTFHDVSEDHAEKYPCTLVEQAKRQREDPSLLLDPRRISLVLRGGNPVDAS